MLTYLVSTGATAAGGHSHWGFQANEGPEHWGDLKEKYATCKAGRFQSPVDINFGSKAKGVSDDIKFNYKDISPEVMSNGHTIQVNYGNDSAIQVSGQEYELVQFHFHTPSENTVNGKHYSMEMHLVRKNSNGELAVLGVFFKEGSQNAELTKAWDEIPTKGGTKVTLADEKLTAANLLTRKNSLAISQAH